MTQQVTVAALRDKTGIHIRQRGKRDGRRLERKKVRDRPAGRDRETKDQRKEKQTERQITQNLDGWRRCRN